jgi:hypothetical protein
MKHMVNVSWTLTDTLPDHVLDDLRNVVYRAGENPMLRHIDRLAGDRLLDEAVTKLQVAGAVRHITGRHQPNHYSIVHRREWEVSDIESAQFLWLQVTEPDLSPFTTMSDDRQLCFDAKDLPRKRVSLGGNGFQAFCNEYVEERLISHAFAHLHLRPVTIVRRLDGDIPFTPIEGGPRWSQLLSDVELPPFAPLVTKKSLKDDALVPREYHGRVSCAEPPFRDFQPVYVRSEWSNVPHFDVAHTFEYHLNPPDLSHWLIVSRRFYEFCKSESLNADWVPVRFVNS